MSIRSLVGATLALATSTACDAQVPADYPGEPLATFRGVVESELPGSAGDVEALVVWSKRRHTGGSEPEAGGTPVELEGEFPSAFTLKLYAPPPEDVLASLLNDGPMELYDLGREPRVAHGNVWVVRDGDDEAPIEDLARRFLGASERFSLVYLDRDVEPGTFAARYFGAELAAGYHILHTEPTVDPDALAELDCQRAAADVAAWEACAMGLNFAAQPADALIDVQLSAEPTEVSEFDFPEPRAVFTKPDWVYHQVLPAEAITELRGHVRTSGGPLPAYVEILRDPAFDDIGLPRAPVDPETGAFTLSLDGFVPALRPPATPDEGDACVDETPAVRSRELWLVYLDAGGVASDGSSFYLLYFEGDVVAGSHTASRYGQPLPAGYHVFRDLQSDYHHLYLHHRCRVEATDLATWLACGASPDLRLVDVSDGVELLRDPGLEHGGWAFGEDPPPFLDTCE